MQIKLLAKNYQHLNGVHSTFMSVLVEIPTSILQEFRTHRTLNQTDTFNNSNSMADVILSMSANSSRAIPFETMIKNIKENMFYPTFTKNKSGMNGELVTDNNKLEEVKKDWEDLLFNEEDGYLKKVRLFIEKHNLHKQTVNRLIDRWSYTTTVISGTEWHTFFDLRCPKYTFMDRDGMPFVAYSKKEFKKLLTTHNIEILEKDYHKYDKGTSQNEFREIAEQLYDLYYDKSEPMGFEKVYDKTITMPFAERAKEIVEKGIGNNSITEEDKIAMMMLVSASLCARISFDKVEEENTLEEHLKRAESCLSRGEWGIAEHQVMTIPDKVYGLVYRTRLYVNSFGVIDNSYEHNRYYTNRGFITLRHMLEMINDEKGSMQSKIVKVLLSKSK